MEMVGGLTVPQLQKLLSKKRLYRADVLELFTLVRILLETERADQKYPQLRLYCNWCVHSKLDRNPQSLLVLEQLTELFVRATTVGFEGGELHLGVANALSSEKLREELVAILRPHGVSTTVFDREENWKGIYQLLIQYLIGRPMEFRVENMGRKEKEIYERCVRKSKGTDFLIRRLELVVMDNRVHWKLLANHDFIDLAGVLPWVGRNDKTEVDIAGEKESSGT